MKLVNSNWNIMIGEEVKSDIPTHNPAHPNLRSGVRTLSEIISLPFSTLCIFLGLELLPMLKGPKSPIYFLCSSILHLKKKKLLFVK